MTVSIVGLANLNALTMLYTRALMTGAIAMGRPLEGILSCLMENMSMPMRCKSPLAMTITI